MERCVTTCSRSRSLWRTARCLLRVRTRIPISSGPPAVQGPILVSLRHFDIVCILSGKYWRVCCSIRVTVRPKLIAFHREFLVGTPDELDTTIGFLNSPDGAPLVAIVAIYAGPPEEGERVLEPLRKFGPPIADLVRPMAYAEAQSMLDNAVPIGDRYYWKSNFVNELSPDLGHVLKEGANTMPSPLSMILMFEIKGEMKRVPKDAMAFDHRDANFELSIIGHWTDPAHDDVNVRWARDVWTAAQPFVSPAVYSNHMTDDEGEARTVAAYGASKYAKLARLKATYDPDNFFCLNHNVRPERPADR